MGMTSKVLMLGALVGLAIALPARGQTVYKCGSGDSVRYTELPCAGRVVDTDDAPVPGARAANARRAEHNRLMAQAIRRKPGESADQYETRRRRARLPATDRDECERLDVRIPVEEASMNNPDPQEVLKAGSALDKSRKRLRELRC